MELKRGVLKFCTYEEEEFVLDYRTSESQTVYGALDVSTWRSQFLAIHPIASQALVLIEMVGRTTKCVRTLFGDGIDSGSHEIAVLHIEGRVNNLDVFKCLKSEGSTRSGHLLAVESHIGVEVSTINTIVVHSAVTSAERTATYIIR